MKIAITGGSGCIRSHISKAYLDAGHDVLVIDSLVKNPQQELDPRIRFYPLDIRDPKLSTILQLERPEILSHHVAQPQRDELLVHALTDADMHIHGLLNVLESCVQAGVRKVLFASSANALCERFEDGQKSSKAICSHAPILAHDISTVAGEWYIRYYTQQYGLQHTIFRYADVYGDAEELLSLNSLHPIPYFICMLLQEQRPVIRGSGHEKRDVLFIDDVVEANFCMLKRGDNHTFFISSGQNCSLNELYAMVAHALGTSLEPLYLSPPLTHTPHIQTPLLDNTSAAHILHWRPSISIEQGIKLTISRIKAALSHKPCKIQLMQKTQLQIPGTSRLSHV